MQVVTMSCVKSVGGIQSSFLLEYPFQYDDGGRTNSKRPKQKSDCTVRAIAITKGLPYDVAYDLLKSEGRKSHRGFNLQKWLNQQPWAKKIAFQAVKGQPRMNPSTFCRQFPNGSYICRSAKHVFAVVDGVLCDTWEQRPDRCIYTAWEIK